MKLNKFFMGLLGALALTACSSEEPVQNGPETIDSGESRFMTVSVRNAVSSTRAAEDYEDGTDQENKVKNIIFYFFDKDGKAINVVNGDKNYFICKGNAKDEKPGEYEDIPGVKPGTGNDANQQPNTEKILNATIVLSSGNNSDNIKDLYSMVAILNYDGFISPKNMSLDELKAIADNYAKNLANENSVPTGYSNSATMPYFVMTSSSYVADEQNETGSYDKVPTFLVKNISGHVEDTEAEAKDNPVDVYVERLVAKVRLRTNWEKEVIIKNVTFNGKTGYTAIPVTDKDKNPVIFTENEVSKQIYVIFEGWGLHGTAQKSWLFKQVSEKWKLDGWGNDGFGWNDASYYRSYWAYNHPDVTATTLKHFTYEQANGVIGHVETGGTNFYCLENAGDDFASGNKKGDDYDPDEAISPRTQVFIKAKLVTLDDNNNATVLKLAEWAGSKYSQDDIITAMLGTVNNDIFIRKEDSRETLPDGSEKINYEYKSIPESMIRLVSGLESGKWTSNKENDKRYLSYLMVQDEKDLTFPEGYERAFYKDKNGTRFVAVDDNATAEQLADAFKQEINLVNDKLLGIIGAKVWEGGKSYYYADLQHLGAKEQNGKYGVVRNHIYDVEINTLTGLGTPVLNPSNGSEEVIIPQHTLQDAFFLGARVNILSWRVVNQNVSLDW